VAQLITQRSVKVAPTTNLWNILADNEFRLHSGYIFAVSNASLLLSQNAVTVFFSKFTFTFQPIEYKNLPFVTLKYDLSLNIEMTQRLYNHLGQRFSLESYYPDKQTESGPTAPPGLLNY